MSACTGKDTLSPAAAEGTSLYGEIQLQVKISTIIAAEGFSSSAIKASASTLDGTTIGPNLIITKVVPGSLAFEYAKFENGAPVLFELAPPEGLTPKHGPPIVESPATCVWGGNVVISLPMNFSVTNQLSGATVGHISVDLAWKLGTKIASGGTSVAFTLTPINFGATKGYSCTSGCSGTLETTIDSALSLAFVLIRA